MYALFSNTTARLAASASTIGILAIWALGWVDPAQANAAGPEAGHYGPQWGGAKQMQHLTRRLDLSELQRERISAILKASRAEGKTLRTDLQTLRSELQAAVKADEFYEDQVRIMIESQTPVMTELMMLGARTMHAVRAELTPEQQAEADALLENFAGARGRHRGRGHWRRHGSEQTQ